MPELTADAHILSSTYMKMAKWRLSWTVLANETHQSWRLISQPPDDIVLLFSDIHEFVDMINELDPASKQFGLKMNMQKIIIMSTENNVITKDQQQIQNVSRYRYLGHNITLGKNDQGAEVTRVSLMWAAFGNLAHILRNTNIPINFKRKVFDFCILPQRDGDSHSWKFE